MKIGYGRRGETFTRLKQDLLLLRSPLESKQLPCPSPLFGFFYISVLFLDLPTEKGTPLFWYVIFSFSPVGSNIWFKLYGPPSDRDVDLIGSVCWFSQSYFHSKFYSPKLTRWSYCTLLLLYCISALLLYKGYEE